MWTGSRTQAAFIFSYGRLQAICPKLYFWTFTPARDMSDREFAAGWFIFYSRLQRVYLDSLLGLRVFERFLGYGERHGRLHCHVVVNEYLSVRKLKELALGTGIGYVMWVRVAREGLGDYLCKYLTKERGLKGVRSWAAFGPWDHCRGKDVELSGHRVELWKKAYSMAGVGKGAYMRARVYFRELVEAEYKEWDENTPNFVNELHPAVVGERPF